MLVEMLKQAESFHKLPVPKQAIYLKLAHSFQESTEYLFMNPEELQQTTELGTKEQWQEFLTDITVQNYTKSQMSFISQISQRKTFQSLVQMALSGNQQAAKQVQELSGAMNSVDNNKIIILHSIPRPNREVNNV